MCTSQPLRIIAAITFVTVFSSSVVEAQVLEPVDSLVVVDANQNRVGKVIEKNRAGIPEVAFKFGDNVFVLRVLRTSFVGGGLGTDAEPEPLWFDELGCTGQAFKSQSHNVVHCHVRNVLSHNQSSRWMALRCM